jgi:hypothetical protein
MSSNPLLQIAISAVLFPYFPPLSYELVIVSLGVDMLYG